MSKPQWITAGIAFLIVIGLYAATQNTIFGPRKNKKTEPQITSSSTTISIDTILFHAKENLTPEQITRISFLEHSISRGDVKDQQIHIYHQLSKFWKDSARVFDPYAWYTAEAARLENSENSLTFAAHLFLNNLLEQGNPHLKEWEAFQAKDLFERSLKINPDNDSSKIGLGAVTLYGGIGPPMEGVAKIREVAAKDPANVYAQMTLGQASLISGQLDKALERFKTVARLHPDNLEAIFRAAETFEQMNNKTEAIEWYSKSLPFIENPAIKQEVEARIAKLKK